jgi:capsular polysaccharide transport system permease protein
MMTPKKLFATSKGSSALSAARLPKTFVVEEEEDGEGVGLGLSDDGGVDDDIAVRIRAVRPPPVASREQHRRNRLRSMLFNLAILVLPPIAATIYFVFICSDIYEVDAVMIVKNPPVGQGAASSSSSAGSALSSMLGGSSGGSPMTRAVDESYAVATYVQSSNAFEELDKKLNLRKYFSSDKIDWWNRLSPNADFVKAYYYYQNHVYVYYDDLQGQILLTTYGFDAETTYKMAEVLSEMSEQVVNRFNQKAQNDFINLARDQVAKMKASLQGVQDKITDFRLHTHMIDPGTLTSLYSGIITSLQADASATQAEISSLKSLGLSQESKVGPLQNRLRSDMEQIKREQTHLTGETGAVAPVLQEYAFLQEELTLVQGEYSSAVETLDSSVFDAERQKLYMVYVVPPEPPVEAQLPRRLKDVLLTIALTVLSWVIIRVIIASIREHMV